MRVLFQSLLVELDLTLEEVARGEALLDALAVLDAVLDALLQDAMLVLFQAEDGIRDIGVTGVQTCALPIWLRQALSWIETSSSSPWACSSSSSALSSSFGLKREQLGPKQRWRRYLAVEIIAVYLGPPVAAAGIDRRGITAPREVARHIYSVPQALAPRHAIHAVLVSQMMIGAPVLATASRMWTARSAGAPRSEMRQRQQEGGAGAGYPGRLSAVVRRRGRRGRCG